MRNTSHSGIFTAAFFLVSAAFFLINMGVEALYSTFSLYIDSLRGSAGAAGALTAVFGVTCIVVRILSGVMSDRFSRWLTLLIGGAVFGVSILLCGITASFPVLFLIRILQAAGYSAATTATASSVATVVSRERLGEAIGYYGIGQGIATAIAPSIALALAAGIGFRRMYILFGLLTALAGALALGLRSRERSTAPSESVSTTDDRPRGLGSLLEQTALPAAAVNFVISFSLSSIISFVTLFAARRGIEGAGLFYVVAAITMFCAKLISGRLSDRLGSLRVLVPGLVLSCLYFSVLAFTGSLPLLLVCAAAYGFCNGMFIPILNAAALQNTPASRVGAASATFYCSLDAGVGIGSVVWGMLIDRLDFTVSYLCAAGCNALALVLALVLLRGTRSGKSPALTNKE